MGRPEAIRSIPMWTQHNSIIIGREGPPWDHLNKFSTTTTTTTYKPVSPKIEIIPIAFALRSRTKNTNDNLHCQIPLHAIHSWIGPHTHKITNLSFGPQAISCRYFGNHNKNYKTQSTCIYCITRLTREHFLLLHRAQYNVSTLIAHHELRRPIRKCSLPTLTQTNDRPTKDLV